MNAARESCPLCPLPSCLTRPSRHSWMTQSLPWWSYFTWNALKEKVLKVELMQRHRERSKAFARRKALLLPANIWSLKLRTKETMASDSELGLSLCALVTTGMMYVRQMCKDALRSTVRLLSPENATTDADNKWGSPHQCAPCPVDSCAKDLERT